MVDVVLEVQCTRHGFICGRLEDASRIVRECVDAARSSAGGTLVRAAVFGSLRNPRIIESGVLGVAEKCARIKITGIGGVGLRIDDGKPKPIAFAVRDDGLRYLLGHGRCVNDCYLAKRIEVERGKPAIVLRLGCLALKLDVVGGSPGVPLARGCVVTAPGSAAPAATSMVTREEFSLLTLLSQ